MHDAADEEAGDDQEQERSGDLRRDQNIADTMTSGARGIAASAFLQHAVQIRAGGAQGRPESYENSGEERRAEGIREDLPIEAKVDTDGEACAGAS